MDNCTNGRVDILGPIGPQFNFADKIPIKHCASYRDALTGSWTDTLLSKMYFSKENIQIIQNAIKHGVYIRSNKQFIIGEQNCDELKIIMRSIFLQHSKNMPDKITEQIIELNNMVLDYAVSQIMGEAIGYIKFTNDSSVMHTPMERPSNTQDFKILEQQPWF